MAILDPGVDSYLCFCYKCGRVHLQKDTLAGYKEKKDFKKISQEDTYVFENYKLFKSTTVRSVIKLHFFFNADLFRHLLMILNIHIL